MSKILTIAEPPLAVAPAIPHPLEPKDLSRCGAAALAAYRYASWPLRQVFSGYLRWQNRAPVLSFFYHHVGPRAEAPWSINFAMFRRQIDWLADRFDMVSYAEAQHRLATGHATPSVHLSFDDGYADNCSQALPYLISRGVPFTYFVASWHVATGTSFSHDVARGLPLAVNTPAQICAMAEAGVEIGAHTRHHHAFSPHDSFATLYDEIVGCKHELEAIIGRPVRYFAFPFGTKKVITPAAVQMVRKAGFKGYCSAYGGYNFPPVDAFHLQRIHGDPSMARFYNWATLDPRKLRIYWQPAEN